MKDLSVYKINVQHEIIYYSFIESVKLKDVKEILMKSTLDSNYSKYFDQVFDYRFCDLSIYIKELTALVSFAKNEIKIDAIRKDIYITSTPNAVVLATLFSKLVQIHQVKPHVVSTIERTFQILSKPNLDITKLDNILNDLKITQPNHAS